MTANTYSNYSSMLVCIPIKFTKKSSKTAQLDANMTTVNNFFGHWFTNIDVRRYPDDMNILSTNNGVIALASPTIRMHKLNICLQSLLKNF